MSSKPIARPRLPHAAFMRLLCQIVGAAIFAQFLVGFTPDAIAAGKASPADEGIRFSCDRGRLGHIETAMARYLDSLGIASKLVVKRTDKKNGTLVYTLNTPEDDFDTLTLRDRPEFAIRDHVVRLPAPNGKSRKVVTVSRKEILLALLQHGRLTEFSGENCSVNALKELVGIRQNIVAWSEDLNWVWPDGGPAAWNTQFWQSGTPLPDVPLHAAFGDVFEHQDKYSIGCYTATKLVVVHGVLDYYRRVKKNPSRLKRIEALLASDREPLVDVEPGRMWSFERDFDYRELARPGKILQIQYGVASRNFVPGDWVYLVNNDPFSSRKTGYEGSNAIYLGRDKFDDFYNDHGHSYTYHEKLDEVYQWRNGVFSRARDAAKIRPLSGMDLVQLSKPPSEGGLVLDFRVFPYSFTRNAGLEIQLSTVPPDPLYLYGSRDAVGLGLRSAGL